MTPSRSRMTIFMAATLARSMDVVWRWHHGRNIRARMNASLRVWRGSVAGVLASRRDAVPGAASLLDLAPARPSLVGGSPGRRQRNTGAWGTRGVVRVEQGG